MVHKAYPFSIRIVHHTLLILDRPELLLRKSVRAFSMDLSTSSIYGRLHTTVFLMLRTLLHAHQVAGKVTSTSMMILLRTVTQQPVQLKVAFELKPVKPALPTTSAIYARIVNVLTVTHMMRVTLALVEQTPR